jgi:hypothetical protein
MKEQKGWILRFPGSAGANGYHELLRTCVEACLKNGYKLYQE